MTCLITRITIYGVVNIRFSEAIKQINLTEVDLDISLKNEENGEEIEIPVEWKVAGLKDQLMSIQMEAKESISGEEMKVLIKFK